MTIQLEDMRISFLWAETVLDHFQAPDAQFLNRDLLYENRFDQVRRGTPDPLGLGAPWPHPGGHMFWTHYLEGVRPGDLSKRKAWKSLVPFRKKLDYGITAPWFGGSYKIFPELFLYPHGQAVVLTFRCGKKLDLDEAIKTAHRFRRQSLELREHGGAAQAMNLNSIAESILIRSRADLFGANIHPARCSPTPFSVVTVVRGSGVDPHDPIDSGGAVHRALEAWTSWRTSYDTDPLPPLAEARLRTRTAPAGDNLYGRPRGRAVWFPRLFTEKYERIRSLSCYHRNQLMAAVQVESLGELTKEAAASIGKGHGPTGTYGDCARRAGGALGRIFGGGASTYRSWSARAHIEQNFVDSVNAVRKYFHGTALSV